MRSKPDAHLIEILPPDIYSFHDYRAYLKELFSYKKETDSAFSLRKLAEAAGMAVGYLPMVLNGKRKLSEKSLAKLLPNLGLTPAELSYLGLLCKISDSDSQEDRLSAVGRLKKFRGYGQHTKEIECFEYLTKWYYVAIREMATYPDFRADPSWIQEQLSFSIPINEIEKALEFLLENKFLEKKSNGTFEAKDKKLSCFSGIYKISLGEFHKQMLELANRAISEVPSEQRLILGETVAISSEDFEKLKDILNQAQEKIGKLEKNKKEKDSVYHVTLAGFPISQKTSGG